MISGIEASALFAMYFSVLVIPGVNFATIVRNTVVHGIRSGIWTAFGISSAILIHVLLSIFSLSLILYRFPFLFAAIKYAGVTYLFYLGTRFIYLSHLRSKKKRSVDPCPSQTSEANASLWSSFRAGFFIDLLNPFVSIFFLTCFSTLVHTTTSIETKLTYAIGIFLLTLVWFAIVSLLFSYSLIQKTLNKQNRWVDRFSGISMYYFALRVLIS